MQDDFFNKVDTKKKQNQNHSIDKILTLEEQNKIIPEEIESPKPSKKLNTVDQYEESKSESY